MIIFGFNLCHLSILSLQVTNLLSDIGGQIGLWIGLSILTVCEIIELVFLIFRALALKCSGENKIKSGSYQSWPQSKEITFECTTWLWSSNMAISACFSATGILPTAEPRSVEKCASGWSPIYQTSGVIGHVITSYIRGVWRNEDQIAQQKYVKNNKIWKLTWSTNLSLST